MPNLCNELIFHHYKYNLIQKTDILKNHAGTIGYPYEKINKNSSDSHFVTFNTVYSNLFIVLKLYFKIIKLLEENQGGNLRYLGLARDFLEITLKEQSIKKHIHPSL